jgi:hypothetical protein
MLMLEKVNQAKTRENTLVGLRRGNNGDISLGWIKALDLPTTGLLY